VSSLQSCSAKPSCPRAHPAIAMSWHTACCPLAGIWFRLGTLLHGISTRGDSTAVKVITTSQEANKKKHLAGSPPTFLPVWSQFCSSRSHRLLRVRHKLLRTISVPSLSLWKVPAVSLAVSANRSIPSHVAFLTWLQVFLPTQQIWTPISKVKADEIRPPCHSRSSVILQQSIVQGKRKSLKLP